MRAPATSPIPAPVSAPQTAKGNEASDASPFAALMEAVNAGPDARTDMKTAIKPSKTEGKVEGKPDGKLAAAPPQDAAKDDAAQDATSIIAPPDGITTDVLADALPPDDSAPPVPGREIADAPPLFTEDQAQPLSALLLMQLQSANTQPQAQPLRVNAGSGAAETVTEPADTTDDAAPPVQAQQLEVEMTPDLLGQVAMVQPAVAPPAPPPPANSNLPDIDPALAETAAPQAPETDIQPPVAQASQADAPQPPAPKPGKKAEAKAAPVNSDQPAAEQRSHIADSAAESLKDSATAQTVVAVQSPASQPAPQAATTAPAAANDTQGVAPAVRPQPANNDLPPPAADTGPAPGADTGLNLLASAPDGTPQNAEMAQNGNKSGNRNSNTGPNPAKDSASTASADAKADAIAASQAASDAPKPQMAAQAPAANTNFAQHLAAAVDADAPVQASTPGITQHVSVSGNAQAAPDMSGLAINIRARSQSGAKQFDIRLDPPELGRVEVRLAIDHAGKASAHLTAEQPQTLDLLQRDSAVLARALRDAGLNVSQDGLNFSLRQDWHGASQNNFAQDMGGRDGARGQRGTTLNASKSIEATATSAAYRAPADGRLDIRV